MFHVGRLQGWYLLCKWYIVNVHAFQNIQFAGHAASVATLLLYWKHPWTIKKWAWLCFIKTLLLKNKTVCQISPLEYRLLTTNYTNTNLWSFTCDFLNNHSVDSRQQEVPGAWSSECGCLLGPACMWLCSIPLPSVGEHTQVIHLVLEKDVQNKMT